MATLYVTEYADSGFLRGPLPLAKQPPNTSQTVSIAAGSNASAAFAFNTNLVRLHADTVCSFAFAAAPTATASSPRMASNTTEYFQVPPGGTLKVAVIQNT